MNFVEYWIARINQVYDKLDCSKLDEKTQNSLVYAASNLFSELEKVTNKTNI